MAEESITISASPEVGSSRRNSIGMPGSPFRASVGVNPRRYSTGKPSSQNSEEILPNYLRASTGSCHDLCKFGHAHGFKAKNSIPKRRVKSVSNEEKDIKTIIVQAERKKTTMTKLKPSPDTKIHTPEPPEIIKREIVLPSKKVEISSKRNSSTNRKTTENELKILAKHSPSVKPKPKPVLVKPSSSSDASVGLNGRRNSENKTGKKMGIPKAAVKKEVLPATTASSSPTLSLTRVAVKKVLPTPTTSTAPKHSVSRVTSLKARKYKNLKLVSPLKDQNRMPKTELKQLDGEKVQEKTLHVIEPKIENEVLESVPTGDIIQSPPSPPVESPENEVLESSFSNEEDSEYTESDGDDYISENDEILNNDGLESSRKGRVIPCEDKDDAGVKIKFRRGKIVDLQSENNAPRRLRFRRGRVLGDNEDGHGGIRKRNFKRKGIEDGEAKDSSLGSENVVLKHQDVQVKKDGQGLLNNVIEETASKLVESRKSKVKALVGAFETVISLQDSKPSAQTVT